MPENEKSIKLDQIRRLVLLPGAGRNTSRLFLFADLMCARLPSKYAAQEKLITNIQNLQMPRLPSSSLPNCPAPDPLRPDVVSLRPIVNQVNRFLHHSFPGRKCSRKTRRGKTSKCLLIRRTATSEPFRPPPIPSSRK